MIGETMMIRIMLLVALGVSACNRQTPDDPQVAAPAAPDELLPGQAPKAQSSGVVPKPEDEAQLDRMILAGYTPHADHLHPPGVKSCPLTKGTEAVM